MTFDKILKTAQGLESYSPYELISINGIELIRDNDFIRGNELARIITHDNHTYIFLKKNIDPKKEVYLLLHELGHYYLHSFRCSLISPSRYEYEADIFACLCLIKCDLFQANTDMWLMDFQVPTKSITNFNDASYQYKMKSKYGNTWLRLEC